jgi:hypothetical protein
MSSRLLYVELKSVPFLLGYTVEGSRQVKLRRYLGMLELILFFYSLARQRNTMEHRLSLGQSSLERLLSTYQ